MRKYLWLGAAALLICAVSLALSERAQFVTGGALINLGYRMQDHLSSFDLVHHEDIDPEAVWQEVLHQNALASPVRKYFPRTVRHPLVAMVVCMDARIDTSELLGDTRKYYYLIRTAGSALARKEEEMLELAAENGVKTIILTTHSDCAAEKAAKNPASRARFPELAAAVDERAARARELVERPVIAAKIKKRELVVKHVYIDTAHNEMLVRSPATFPLSTLLP